MDKNTRNDLFRALMYLWNTFGGSILEKKKKKVNMQKRYDDSRAISLFISFHLMQTSIIYI